MKTSIQAGTVGNGLINICCRSGRYKIREGPGAKAPPSGKGT